MPLKTVTAVTATFKKTISLHTLNALLLVSQSLAVRLFPLSHHPCALRSKEPKVCMLSTRYFPCVMHHHMSC